MEEHAKLIDQVIDAMLLDMQTETKDLEERLAERLRSSTSMDEARLIVASEFGVSEQRQTRILNKMTELAGDDQNDLQIVNTLRDTATATVVAKNTITRNEVLSLLAVEYATGGPDLDINLVIPNVRGRISGYMMTSTDPVVRRNQRRLEKLFKDTGANKKEIATAVEVIRERLSGVNTTASLRDLTSQATNETVMEFDGSVIYSRAVKAGITKYRYAGGTIDTTRPWCKDHVDETYTEAEINTMWQSSWAGKKSGNPFIVRGGWNCRHFWVPVED